MSCHTEAIDQLREAGARLTPQRAMVLDVIYHAQGHLTADEVYARVQSHSPYVDLSTVYRTLLFLKQQGLIGELRLNSEAVRYEAIRSGHEHHHAVCSQCCRIVEVDGDDLAGISRVLAEKYDFQVNLVHLTIPGLCADCAAE